MELAIASATTNDIDAIYRLIRSERKYLLRRTKQEIRKNLNNFIVARNSQTVVGCAAFENYSPKIAEIRSLVVVPNYRGKKVGQKLMKVALRRARRGQEVFVVTSHPQYFQKLGFNHSLKEKYILFRKK